MYIAFLIRIVVVAAVNHGQTFGNRREGGVAAKTALYPTKLNKKNSFGDTMEDEEKGMIEESALSTNEQQSRLEQMERFLAQEIPKKLSAMDSQIGKIHSVQTKLAENFVQLTEHFENELKQRDKENEVRLKIMLKKVVESFEENNKSVKEHFSSQMESMQKKLFFLFFWLRKKFQRILN